MVCCLITNKLKKLNKLVCYKFNTEAKAVCILFPLICRKFNALSSLVIVAE
jgi:hypothetical protein